MEDKGLLKSVFGNFAVQPSDDLVLSLLLKPLTNRMVCKDQLTFYQFSLLSGHTVGPHFQTVLCS